MNGSYSNLDGFDFDIDDIDVPSSEILFPTETSQGQAQNPSEEFISSIPSGDLGVRTDSYPSHGSAMGFAPQQQYDPMVVEHFRNRLNPAPAPPFQSSIAGSSVQSASTSAPPVQRQEPVAPPSSEGGPLILKGRNIQDLMVDSVNFICGCSGFMPLQNELFLEVVKEHFVERLKDPSFYALCEKRYPVRDEVLPIIEKARIHSRIRDVRIWTVVGKNRLRESNWMEMEFEDVTNNAVRRRERLESPLRSVLTRLYLNSTSNKADRYPKPRGPSDPVPYQGSVPSATMQPQQVSFPPIQGHVQQPEGYGVASVAAQLTVPAMTTNAQQGSYGMESQLALPQNTARQRSHAEMMGAQSAMLGQWGQTNRPGVAPTMLTTPTVPETDRHWELRGETDGMILYEDAMMTELSEALNMNYTHVASLSSVVNEQMKDQASSCLARKIAKKWLEENPKIRWVCWIDASDPLALADSYRRALKSLRSGGCYEQQAAQRQRLSPAAAAREFLDEYISRFSSQFECLIVYVNVGHPEIFTEGFLPSSWMQDMHCQSTMKGILLSTPHPMYEGNMGPPFGSVVQHSIEWIPNWSESEKRYWWDRLPQSNLPPLLDDVNEPPGIDRKLAYDGRAVALVDESGERPDRAGDIANQFARRWEMAESTERFCLWLKASDEKSLRDSYRSAIRRVTHSTPQTPLGNPVDLSLRVMGDELMSILMKLRELSPSKQFIMVFEGATNDDAFHKRFFSGKSNWWNSKGRFIITTNREDVSVEVLDQLKPVPVILTYKLIVNINVYTAHAVM